MAYEHYSETHYDEGKDKQICARYWKQPDGLQQHEYGGIFQINSCQGEDDWLAEEQIWTANDNCNDFDLREAFKKVNICQL